jgi:ornithine cyclodeaminase/alanine dehydrogenase-like protein (mu-crystallin family)
MRSTLVTRMLILSEQQVRQALSMTDCLRVNQQALVSLVTGEAQVPTRIALPYADTSQRQPVSAHQRHPSRPPGPQAEDAQDWTLFKPASYSPKRAQDDGADAEQAAMSAHSHSYMHTHSHSHHDSDSSDSDNDSNTPSTHLMGQKIVSIRAQNANRGLPLVPATVVLLDAASGMVDSLVAATYLTAARTAAGSAWSVAVSQAWREQRLKSSKAREGEDERESSSGNHCHGQQHSHNHQQTDSHNHAHEHAHAHEHKHNTHQQDHRPATTTADNNDNHSHNLLSSLHLTNLAIPHHVVIFGAGLQAECHLHAFSTLYQSSIPKVTLINRSLPRAQSLATLAVQQGWADHVHVCTLDDRLAVTDSLATASLVVTCTNTRQPLWQSTAVDSECHYISVGSYTPDMREIPARVVDETSMVWLDTPEARQVGDLQSLAAGHPVDLLGRAMVQLMNHEASQLDTSRASYGQPCTTMYKSVGTAIQDLLTANVVVERAREMGLGTEVDMS